MSPLSAYSLTIRRPGTRFAVSVTLTVGFIGLLLIGAGVPLQNKNPTIILLFGVITIWSAVQLSRTIGYHSVSINLIHWFFSLVFLGIAPLLQYLHTDWRFPEAISDSILILTCLVVLTWLVLYSIIYEVVTPQPQPKTPTAESPLVVSISRESVITVLLLSVGIAFGVLVLLGPGAFVTRAARSAAVSETVGFGAVGIFLLYFLRPLALLGLVTGVAYYRYSKFPDTTVVALTISSSPLVLFVNNPLGSARFWAFSLIFGAAIFAGIGWVRNGVPYLMLLFIGVFISQIINTFRYANQIGDAHIVIRDLSSYLQSGHFDAFENLVHVLRFTDANGFVWGRQLSGALMFWIPRSVWNGKPVSTGIVVYEWVDRTYPVWNVNVATPLISEAWINFGIIGVMLYAVLYAYLIAVFDARLEQASLYHQKNHQGMHLFALFPPFLIGFFLLHFRGGFLSSFTYIVLFVCAAVIVSSLLIFDPRITFLGSSE